MSKSSKKNSKNFEQLYYSLKEEYDQMQKDNNEIYKEYESTIQMLTDSIKELQNQRNIMAKNLSNLEKEKENLQNKNRDKINDIQELNKQNEKLIQEMKKIKEDKKAEDTKIIILENDSEYFQKLIRQNEAIIDELNIKMEEVLEDNITMQTEYEIYKQIMTEKLMRKEDELKEIKNDMFSKELMIKKLKINNKDNILIKNKLSNKKSKNGNSNNKKNISKINHSYDYSRDNNFSFSFTKEKLPLNSNKKNDSSFKINGNKAFIPLLSLLNCIKESAKKIGLKFTKSDSLKNDEKNNSNSLRTPSKNKIKKNTTNCQNYSSRITLKKSNEDIYEFKQINKFVLDTNSNGDNDYLRNDETTADLSAFKKGNEDSSNFSLCIDNDFSSNIVSNEKKCNDKIIICQKKNIDVEPFKNVFLKKLLKTKKLSHNMEKLMNFNYPKGKKISTYGKWNPKIEKIGYRLK